MVVFLFFFKTTKINHRKKSFLLLEPSTSSYPTTPLQHHWKQLADIQLFISDSRGENSDAVSIFLAIRYSWRIRVLFNKSHFFFCLFFFLLQFGQLMSHPEVVQMLQTVLAFIVSMADGTDFAVQMNFCVSFQF